MGEPALSRQALEKIAGPAGMTAEELAQRAVQQVLDQLKAAIGEMFKSWGAGAGLQDLGADQQAESEGRPGGGD